MQYTSRYDGKEKATIGDIYEFSWALATLVQHCNPVVQRMHEAAFRDPCIGGAVGMSLPRASLSYVSDIDQEHRILERYMQEKLTTQEQERYLQFDFEKPEGWKGERRS